MCLINDDEEERFSTSNDSETDLALNLLRLLRTQGPGSFDKFCDVLLQVEDGTLCAVEKCLRDGKRWNIAAHEDSHHAGSGSLYQTFA